MKLPNNLPDLLQEWGLKVEQEPGWQTRKVSGPFNPVGVMCHHTAIDDDAASVRVVRDGRPDLKGPLSQFVLKKDGTVVLIAAGRANHAGSGEYKGIKDGNFKFIGIEAVHSGSPSNPWPHEQLEAWYSLCAALLELLETVSSSWVIFHKTWTPRKIDPILLNLQHFQTSVSLATKPVPETDKSYFLTKRSLSTRRPSNHSLRSINA